ncbi:MAG TPA: hypothetical protein VI336_00870 [Candidatus Saccharimonadales bacterium]|nr:hypothetical protein [Candidatus Saccharimonadales bacterium]
MERKISAEVATAPPEYRESLERARKEFPALIRRLSNTISSEETEALTNPEWPEFNPHFEYPKLFDLNEDELAEKRRIIDENLAFVNQIEQSGYTSTITEEFDKEKAMNGLTNVYLLTLAQRMQRFPELEQEKNAEMFMRINERLNGPVDSQLYQGVVNRLHEIIDEVKSEQPVLYKIARELRLLVPEKQGDDRIVTMPKEIFDEYSRAYHLIYDNWLNEVIPEEKDSYSAQDIYEAFERTMSIMGFEANVEIQEDIPSIKYNKQEDMSIKYNKDEKKFYIPSSRILKHDQLRAKIVHEIGHLTRGWNGSYHSRDAENGLPEYLDAEDGLMSYGEEFITGKQHSNPTYVERYLGVGLLTGTVGGAKKDFKDTFAAMWRARLLLENQNLITEGRDIEVADIASARKESLMNAQRLFRGGDGRTPGLGWTKDKVYYEGVAKLNEFLVDFERRYGLEYITILFAAKFDPTNSLHNKYLGMPLKA